MHEALPLRLGRLALGSLLLAMLPAAWCLGQEPVRLPSVYTTTPTYPAQQTPSSAAGAEVAGLQTPLATPGQPYPPLIESQDVMLAPGEPWLDQQQPSTTTPGQREGIFQKVIGQATWLPAPTSGDLGMTDLEISAVFGFPLPTRESPLLVTPAFAVRYLDGPATSELPPRLFDATMQFRWLRPIGERWVADVAVAPGVYSDFQVDDSDALRITGHGVAIFKWNPATKLVFGVAYLDRDDVAVLPVGGVIWQPNDQWSFELLVPRPKIARRLWCLSAEPWKEYWGYVAGEFGGGQWAIERSMGAHDTVTLRDYRILLGLERKAPGGLGSLIEIGYVFGRSVEYQSGLPDFHPDPTLLVRIGTTY